MRYRETLCLAETNLGDPPSTMLSPASPTRSSREEQLFRLAQIVEAASLSSDPACAHLSPKDVQRQWLEKGVRQAQMVPRQLERVSASRGKEPVRTEQDAAAVVGRSLAGRPSGSGGGAKLAVGATVWHAYHRGAAPPPEPFSLTATSLSTAAPNSGHCSTVDWQTRDCCRFFVIVCSVGLSHFSSGEVATTRCL